ncbi:MAG: IS30 family transposase [Microbacterium sp.]
MGRPPVRVEVHREFWAQVALGLSVVDAGGAVGVSRATAQRLFARCGGVIPSRSEPVTDPVNGRSVRLSFSEREDIARYDAQGLGVRQIAREMGRSPGTISRELARSRSGDGHYRASVAQQNTDQRARHGGTARPAKLATNLRLRREVQNRLAKNDSPEQIAERLRVDFPDEPEMWVSHETIYQSIYIQGRGGLKRELAKHLRTGRSLRKPQRQGEARRARGERIKDMISITERPEVDDVDGLRIPGNWEGDLILGAENRTAIGTLVERATGYLILLHLPHNHGAIAVQEAITHAVAGLPDLMRKTLTWDQGIEMANHAKTAEATGLDIYFCDPASPWQRPSNENTNGLLRQYFPKGTNLSFHGPGILERVAIEMNNRPRKRLAWATPAEAYDKLLTEHEHTTKNTGVADAG